MTVRRQLLYDSGVGLPERTGKQYPAEDSIRIVLRRPELCRREGLAAGSPKEVFAEPALEVGLLKAYDPPVSRFRCVRRFAANS